MINTNTDEDIFQPALEAVRNNISIPIHFKEVATELNVNKHLRVDKTIEMTINDNKTRFCVEIKKNINKAVIGLMAQQKACYPHPFLLVTNYVNATIADYLKQIGIEFIDAAGNAYINQPLTYIFVKGNRPPETFRQVSQGKVFTPTGLKVVFTFLCYPDLVNKTYREIARTAGVALGTIGWIITDLKKQGFVLDRGHGKGVLTRKEQLLHLWIAEYPKRLRQQLLVGRYRGNQDWWRQKDLNPEQAQWGGEAAAALLTKHLKPENITLYADQQNVNNVLIENRLKKDISGEIEILKRFWIPFGETERNKTVPPILVYADLMATADQRNIETAKVIYERYIVRFVRED